MHPIKNEYCPFTNNNEIKPITVTEDEVKNSIVSLSKLDTLVKKNCIYCIIKIIYFFFF